MESNKIKLAKDKINQRIESIKKEITILESSQLSKKVQLNSIYGSIGSQYCRYFDIRLSEAITLGGQLAIKSAIYQANNFLNKEIGKEGFEFVVASDTDSMMINLGPVVDMHFSREDQRTKKNEIIDWIDNYSKTVIDKIIVECYENLAKEMNCKENRLSMKREKIAEVGLYTGRKRYALLINDEKGFRYKEPKLKCVGLETQRSSTPKLVRTKLEELIYLCLTDTNKSVIDFLDIFRKEIYSGSKYSLEEISSNSTANMSEYEYVGGKFTNKTPHHIRGALIYNQLIDSMKLGNKIRRIEQGEKIKVIELNDNNPYGIAVLSYMNELPTEFGFVKDFIDYQAQFEKIFMKPASSIIEACGYRTKEVRSLI